MGCQHSLPVPTAADFSHVPSSRGLAAMDDTIALIEDPGMCYSLRMEHIQYSQQRNSPQISSSSNGSCPGRQTLREERRKQRQVSSTIWIFDNPTGLGFGTGLYIDGPSNKGRMVLRSGRGKPLAVLRPTPHPTYDLHYEILCPKRPSPLLLVDERSSASVSLSSSWSSLDHNPNSGVIHPNQSAIHHHHQQQQQQQQEDSYSSNHDSRFDSRESSGWHTWGTVFKVPHKLEYQMSLWIPPPLSSSNQHKDDEELVYRLGYCGAVLGPCQMRIDTAAEQPHHAPLAWMKEHPIGTTRRTQQYRQPYDTDSTTKTWLSSSWDFVIGPGVDPCLLICFAAIVNHGTTTRTSTYSSFRPKQK